MTQARGPYTLLPPVLTANIESATDVMIARNTARRAASLLGFIPARQAQLAGATTALAELMLKTGVRHTLHYSGVTADKRIGVQMSVTAPWLTGAPSGNVMTGLRAKLGELVDEILLETKDTPTIIAILWQTAAGEAAGGEDANP